MRIGLQTWGTEGDVRPMAALAAGLAGRGHEVALAYTSVDGRDYRATAAAGGFSARSIGAAYFGANRAAIQDAAAKLFEVKNPMEQLRAVNRILYEPVAEEIYQAAEELCAANDAVVVHFLDHAAVSAAIKKGLPLALVATAPVFPSRHYAPAGMKDLGRLLNPIQWWVAGKVVSSIFSKNVNALRAKHGVPPMRSVYRDSPSNLRLVLNVVSPMLFPRPADWDERFVVSGFVDLPRPLEPWEPPPDFDAFLGAGPPVYFTFGSLLDVDRVRGLESVLLVAQAVELAGARAVIQAPPELLAELPAAERLYPVTRAPHGQVFPRCSVVVHHGGAGTTHAVVAAGRPSVVVPHVTDQTVWGTILEKRGVAPPMLDRRKATPEKLAARIRQALDDPDLAKRAEALGTSLRGEDGLGTALDLIESRLGP